MRRVTPESKDRKSERTARVIDALTNKMTGKYDGGDESTVQSIEKCKKSATRGETGDPGARSEARFTETCREKSQVAVSQAPLPPVPRKVPVKRPEIRGSRLVKAIARLLEIKEKMYPPQIRS